MFMGRSSYPSWRGRGAPALVLLLALTLGVPVGLTAAPAAAAGPCDPPVTNPVACENTKPGNPESEWGDFRDDSIQGFATDISANKGATIRFKIKTPATSYHIAIYRMGFYDGDGARRIATIQPSAQLPQAQPACLTQASTGLVDCGNWNVSASWTVPADAVSGVYRAVLSRDDVSNADNHILFVVRDDSDQSDMLFQTSDTTWQAYNIYGGNNLYQGTAPAGRAYAVSYNRPLNVDGEENLFENAEYPMIRWLEANGYDLSYTTGVDSDRRGALIKNHKLFLSVGHDEYWSGPQRANVEAARDAGVHLAFFSGNEVFWKTRWESSIDGSGTSHRTLVCYKETKANAPIDPADPPTWTGTWRDPTNSPPADGGRPENDLIGQIFMVNGYRSDAITVPAEYGKMRLWRNTSVANLQPGQKATFPSGTLGYEWDSYVDNGSQPAGVARLSSTTVEMTGDYVLKDHGNTYGPGTATHALTLYKAPSGALVFGAGTVQWSWGLDPNHEFSGPPDDIRMKQATVNLFADMGAQPATLRSGLVPATKSTDTTPPVSAVTSPTGSIPSGTPVTITGTAADGGGGTVAGVEVSVDGGRTWHPADGLDNWTYRWTPGELGQATIKTRAVDDSANLESPRTFDVTVQPRACPCSIWDSSTTPGQVDSGDAGQLELGVKFRAELDGHITGIRFYKSAANTGTHTGSLWSASGAQLTTATFTNETASGWQQVSFSQPVAITANITYVASYHTNAGHYSANGAYFSSGSTFSYPLQALGAGVDGPNGVFKSGASGFPTQSFNNTNYWVDVVLDTDTAADTTPPRVLTSSPGDNANSVAVSTDLTAAFSESVQSSTLTFELRDAANNLVPGSLSYASGSRTATFDPNANLAEGATYTATVMGAKDLFGNTMSPHSWSFKTAKPPLPAGTCPCMIWSDQAVPRVAAVSDGGPFELGVKFRANADGYVTGVRFYKGPGNDGTHTGTLWSSSGTQLATATFTGEGSSGWQQVDFDSPVAVIANATYVASYHTSSGNYAADSGYFTGFGSTYGPLMALAAGIDGPNGVYKSGASGFPTQSFNNTNYWVDVVFERTLPADTTPPTVTGRTPAPGSTGNSILSAVTARFSEPVQVNTIAFQLRDPGGAVVPAAVTYDDTSRTATLTPSSKLVAATTYTAAVSGATDRSGNDLAAPVSWSFTTGGPVSGSTSIWSSTTVPTVASVNDSNAVEVGVKFSADVDGHITGIRFYKGTANTGTHTGTLWSASGAQLATATFTNETASGWQQVDFDAPVAVTGGTVYVASYHTDSGHYAADSGYFASHGADNTPVHALPSTTSGNGVYRYGPSGFPTNTYDATNYWVDVVFTTSPTDTRPPAVTSRAPAPNATGVALGTNVQATFSEAIDETTLAFQLRNADDNVVPAGVSYNPTTLTATLNPSANLAPGAIFSVSVRASDTSGNAMAAPVTWSFTTGTPSSTCPCSIWSSADTPAVASANDPTALELGVKFRSDSSGFITGIRFYKGTANTGTHTGTLWSASGAQLATATFTNETASGWQQVDFDAPVAITANTTYVASYHTDTGGYAYNSTYFANSGADNAPLHALRSGVDGLNGVFLVGPSGFPTNSYNSTNYWVDVVFTT
jgi:methionine-rich copper-binding protein CopC